MQLSQGAAIVTGSATGIGRATALALAGQGCRVLVNYSRSRQEAEQTVADIEALGSEALLAQGDVARQTDCGALVQAAVDAWGRLDVLVNNAGVTNYVALKDLEAMAEEDWDRTFAVNVKGAFFMARAAERWLRAAGGSIVNVSSIAGLSSVGSSIAYAASKAALNNLTLSLARALAPEVRVNAVAPGCVQTRWLENILGGRAESVCKLLSKQTPLGKISTPEEVAGVILSVLGMEQVTGQVLVVDGGFLVRG